MAPFLPPKIVLSGFKEKIDSLLVQGDRTYLGTATGNLHVYSHDPSGDLTLVEVKKSLTKRSIEQLGFIKDVNSVVTLSETTVTLFPLPSFSPPTILSAAKAAFSFTIHSYTYRGESELQGQDEFTKPAPIPVLMTYLLVGCRRKVVIYSWKDGEAQALKEHPLPHSPRIISFMNDDLACFAYSATEYAVFSLSKKTVIEVTMPLPLSAPSSTMGALTGFSGYMTLGLGAKSKPGIVKLNEAESLIIKDNEGIIIGKDAKPSRSETIGWQAPPEEIAFIKPYIFSVLPPGSIPSTNTDPGQNSIPTSVVQIRSSISLLPIQTYIYPFREPSRPSSPAPAPQPSLLANATIRLMSPSLATNHSIFLVTTPTDRATATSEGSSIWQFEMKTWSEQIDELVLAGQYSDALKFLESIESKDLSDKDDRRVRIRALNAVSEFEAGQFDKAIDTFTELNINPAKVVALYPESISGRLSVPRDKWIELYGGPPKQKDVVESPTEGSEADSKGSETPKKSEHERSMTATDEMLDNLGLAGPGSIRGRLKGLGVLMGAAAAVPTTQKDDDTASVKSQTSRPSKVNSDSDYHKSVESLVRSFLPDRRVKLGAALNAVGMTPADQAHEITSLSAMSVEDLYALPNAPFTQLTPEQLLRYAQIVDTALFKSYLVVRPILAGSLFRVPNWCEVEEVEGVLRARGMFRELKDLYHQKKMHRKALELLRQLGEKEEDLDERVYDSVQYLRKLGPGDLGQVFESARWVIEQNSDRGLEIFKSEDVDLPRNHVADYLEKISPLLCTNYLEYLIQERGEVSVDFHDRLVELYAKITLEARRKKEENLRQQTYDKLMTFISTTTHYRVDRLYGLLSSEDLFEARAILLGKLGRHDQALELYVYRLQDYLKAEEYCKQYYQAGTATSNVFLTLLRIYLRPTVKTNVDLLKPALELISRHSRRLDTTEALQLLPPLVTLNDVQTFLIEGLRIPIFDTDVIRQISKARDNQMARKLMSLQMKRVKVTDSRICPQCHKRIGSTIIAVHSPRGEVTHFSCREAFARKLHEFRR
ncbi:uncharacterized protein C8R40DRAFT_1161652 [Lentinula edodes]|uniref:uncharacterized protein n=1 Tax=Lentinula edodes TaxID=5353 RepID=UPI001E8DA2F8|nr:uncharacterized protein C8R40DRAFT_1161652 [Lentinula edodes]KAH7873389.1 hypothetical protein C8R40DRAFT_1161652 [Lentinula edodes]KAJ3921764.1 hypothetical protein F5877DRAFT_88636 [Lentinula edodes]